MHQYRIAIPANHADELASILRDRASLEGVVPLPADLRDDDPMSVQADAPMAVFLVEDQDLESLASIKSWLDMRSEPQLDVRGEVSGMGFSFSFSQHSLDELRTWAEKRTAGRP